MYRGYHLPTKFIVSKRIAKTGTKLLIPLLVIDTAWSLIRMIIFHTAYNGEIPETFAIIDNITTNLLFTSFLIVLTIGMFMLAIYYQKHSKIGIYSSTLLIAFIGIKAAFIFFRFTQLLGNFDKDYMQDTFHIFELVTALLLIAAFILYDIFQYQLKKNANIGYGRSPFPYLFGFFALFYPIANFLHLIGVEYQTNNAAYSVMRTFSYAASILEIILYFDLLRRFDFMQTLDAIPVEPSKEEDKKEE